MHDHEHELLMGPALSAGKEPPPCCQRWRQVCAPLCINRGGEAAEPAGQARAAACAAMPLKLQQQPVVLVGQEPGLRKAARPGPST